MSKREARAAAPAGEGAKLAERALEASDASDTAIIEAELEAAIEQLTPEQAALFAQLVAKAMRKRRILLLGYLLALVSLLVGLVASLYVYAARAPGTFVGWVFFIPFTLVAVILLVFGRWSARV